MKLNVTVKNFGKIKKADLKIRPFTVIAGKNASGKSFATKALYSFFSAINKDFVTTEAVVNISKIISLISVSFTTIRLSMEESFLLEEVRKITNDLRQTVDHIYGENTFTNQVAGSSLLKDKVSNLKLAVGSLVDVISTKKKYKKIQSSVDALHLAIKQLETVFLQPVNVVVSKIRDEFSNSLKENFQSTSLSGLKNFQSAQDEFSEFEFDLIGGISIHGESVAFNLNPGGIDLLQDFSNMVYMESPLYWRLLEPLDKVRELSKYSFLYRHKKQESLSGVPGYFYDLMDLLKERVKVGGQSCEYTDLKDRIVSTIGGQLMVNQSGEINFKDKQSGKELNLHTTASGVVNLGIVGLLLERNIISKGSYIFIDEPEVNLHPAWQKLMVDALYELTKSGINVVIATHSIDMMKCIELIVDTLSDEEAEERFGINELSCDGVSVDGGKYPARRIASIKDDLGASFFEMQTSRMR